MIDELKLRDDYLVSPQVGTYYYVFNVTDPALKDARVRKALTMALDRKELVTKVTKGGQLPADSIAPPMAGYTPAKGNAYDVAKAKALLAEAGFPDGKGFPKLTVIYNTHEGHKLIAEYIQQVWNVITSYSIHYTKLYECLFPVQGRRKRKERSSA